MPKKELTLKQSLFKEMMEDSLTKSEVLEIARKLIAHIKKVDARNKKDLEAMNSFIQEASNNAKNDTSKSFNELKGNITALLDKLVLDSNTTIGKKIEDLNIIMSEVKDGEDADEELIVGKVLDKIRIPEIEEIEKDLPKLGEPIRDALELLQGDERLDVSAIKGFNKALDKFGGKLPKPQYVGGNPRPTFIDDENLSGTKNGVNKIFTTTNTPSPASSLKVYRNGQRLKATTDYTLSGNAVTLVTDVAPASDEELYCDYRM